MKQPITVMRSSRSTLAVFGVIATICALPGMYLLWKGRAQGCIPLGGGALLFLPFLRYRVSWDSGTLSYRGALTSGTVAFRDISRFRIQAPAPGNPFQPTVGLWIFVKSKRKPAMIINLKVFSREDIATLMVRLRQGDE